MPVKIRKLPRQKLWRVYNGERVVALGTTKKNAEKQARLLRGLEHGMVPKKRK